MAIRWRAQYYAQDPCVYCGARHSRMTAEHVTPISAGGKHWFNNQVIACRTCNRWRSNTPLLLWLVALHRAQGNALIAARLVKRGLHA